MSIYKTLLAGSGSLEQDLLKVTWQITELVVVLCLIAYYF